MHTHPSSFERHGWLILDKPLGLSSTQALGRARRLLKGKKVGHGGTLDPLATGILPLAFGEATKLIPHVMMSDKEYEFTIRWGEFRTTDDGEGEVASKSDERPSSDQIEAALFSFTGSILQKPPAFSAIKVGGQRAYALARKGKSVELASREVVIHSYELIKVIDKDNACFRVVSGKGMYVRALARDLAQKLGTCGYVSHLRRTRVGAFKLEDAVTLEKMESSKDSSAFLWPLQKPLGDMPLLSLADDVAAKVKQGQKIALPETPFPLKEGEVVVAQNQGIPLALLEVRGGQLQVLRGFHF